MRRICLSVLQLFSYVKYCSVNLTLMMTVPRDTRSISEHLRMQPVSLNF